VEVKITLEQNEIEEALLDYLKKKLACPTVEVASEIDDLPDGLEIEIAGFTIIPNS